MTEVSAKERILHAARRQFAEQGFRRATLRAIAAEAECDVALIPHYFGSKDQLFRAAIDFPVEIQQLISSYDRVPYSQLGEWMITHALGVWDSPLVDSLMAALKRQLDSPHVIAEFLDKVLWAGIYQRVLETGVDAQIAAERIGLAQAQFIGVLVGRYFLQLPGLVSRDSAELAAELGPIIQGILDGA